MGCPWFFCSVWRPHTCSSNASFANQSVMPSSETKATARPLCQSTSRTNEGGVPGAFKVVLVGAKSLSERPQFAADAFPRIQAMSSVSSRYHATWLPQRRSARRTCFEEESDCARMMRFLSILISIADGHVGARTPKLDSLSSLSAHTPGALSLALPSLPRRTRTH